MVRKRKDETPAEPPDPPKVKVPDGRSKKERSPAQQEATRKMMAAGKAKRFKKGEAGPEKAEAGRKGGIASGRTRSQR